MLKDKRYKTQEAIEKDRKRVREWKDKRKSSHFCRECNNLKVEGKNRCEKHLEYDRKR